MLKSARIWLRQRPLMMTFTAVALYYAAGYLLKLALELLPRGGGRSALALSLNCGLAWALALILGYGWAYQREGFGKTLGAGMGLFVPQAMLFLSLFSLSLNAPQTWTDAGETWLQLLKLFTIAFSEETLFRGIAANAFGIRYGRDGRGVWRAVLLSGLLFGLMHLSNLLTDVRLLSVLVQSAVACGAGMLLTAVYYRGGCLWAPILIHFITDAASLFPFQDTVTETEVLNSLSVRNLLPLAYLLPLTAFLLRPRKMGEALATLAAHRRLDAPSAALPADTDAPGDASFS